MKKGLLAAAIAGTLGAMPALVHRRHRNDNEETYI
jgi:hypothetical protein